MHQLILLIGLVCAGQVTPQPYRLADRSGVVWTSTNPVQLRLWIERRNNLITTGAIPQSKPEPKPRAKRRYGPGPDDWEYATLP